jgi:hypothetical protein
MGHQALTAHQEDVPHATPRPLQRLPMPRIARTRSTGAVANSEFVLRELPTSSGVRSGDTGDEASGLRFRAQVETFVVLAVACKGQIVAKLRRHATPEHREEIR